MPQSAKAGVHLGGVAFRFLFAVVGTWVIFISPPSVLSQTIPTITNVAQLVRIVQGQAPVVRDVRLDVTVFACDTNAGVVIVRDGHGVGLLELDGLDRDFHPGDKILIECPRCFIRPGDLGIRLSAQPLLDNDGIHSPRTCDGEYPLAAGRYPVRLDWFNQYYYFNLEVSCAETNHSGETAADMPETNLLHVTHAECYEGNWIKIPNFQLYQASKTGNPTNFDVGFRTRNEMVGIRFIGYLDIPRAGNYYFSLRSDDGSQLWIGSTGVPVNWVGTGSSQPAPPAALGESMARPDDCRLATIEGRVSFVYRRGKGLRFELRSEPNSVQVALADAGPLEPEDLLNAYVRVSGVASGVLCADQRTALGRLVAVSSTELAILRKPPGKGEPAPVLTTVQQVQNLTTNDAARELPVIIRGVVTAAAAGTWRWMSIQDDTRGSFVRINSISNFYPNVGEFWEITGRTQPGDFAPIIVADQAKLLGRGRLPDPVHPTWGQLANGSMDVQWVELQGLVTAIHTNGISLFLPEGREDVKMEGWAESDLKRFDKAVVRIRGTLFAVWNRETHEVEVGNVEIRNASVSVDKPAPDNPFDAPQKTARGLFHFDARATPFQRVKVRGQATYMDSTRIFIESGAGVQVVPASTVSLEVGDLVEAVGYPELSGSAPLLREALLRTIGRSSLPDPPTITDSELPQVRLASTRIRLQGILLGQHQEEGNCVLQMQTSNHVFQARIARPGSLNSLRPGSKLSLTGIYNMPGNDASHFELLLNTSADVSVLAHPPWWTLERLLAAVGVLLVTLTLSAVWITLLRRQVTQRTHQLHHEIRERERAERQHALEAERSRIARDLHDDLGSSLTEINVLASTGQRPRPDSGGQTALFKSISDKARGLIEALDVIVWAVNPEDNSLQSLADYLSGYTREYLSNTSVACRFKIPITLPNVTLDGKIRHELLMVVKETLNNIVRHSGAGEAEFQIKVTGDLLEILIADDGKGFDPTSGGGGYGLKNRSVRLARIGGSCRIESLPGRGALVCIQLPLATAGLDQRRESNTTFD